jgi:hypothetical protein
MTSRLLVLRVLNSGLPLLKKRSTEKRRVLFAKTT